MNATLAICVFALTTSVLIYLSRYVNESVSSSDSPFSLTGLLFFYVGLRNLCLVSVDVECQLCGHYSVSLLMLSVTVGVECQLCVDTLLCVTVDVECQLCLDTLLCVTIDVECQLCGHFTLCHC